MTKSKNWIVAIVALVVLVALVVGVMLISKGNNKDANAVMECSVNPSVQFILNSDNKVVGVNVLNEDGEKIVAETNFEGKTAEEAAKLFVKLSTEAGKIDVETTGTTVNVTIYGETSSDFDALKDKVTKKINEYFSENGIIAGAATQVSTDLKEALSKLHVSASEYAEKTTEEVLALITSTTEDLKATSVTLRNELMTAVNDLKAKAASTIDTLNESIADFQERIKALPDGELKKNLEKQLATAKENLAKAEKELNDKIDKAIADIQERSEKVLADAKKAMAEAKKANETIIKNHKDAFEKDKKAIEDSIKAYQESLNK